ncbi:hypothetical protein A3Q56_08399 [Intoshia linei]|uniref:Uncharacterized protein n=1 Tax=Intoshia linei TaxID=1819745 RepID=A0A177APE0_9BILA|nr:hypothetical protein A3Q56_08399 [Intoshia linei]
MEKEKLLIYEHNGLSRDDITVIFIYFVILMLISIYTGYKSKKGTISEYFLAGRFITWLPVGASLFASNIGSEHFIGLSGSGAASGIAVGAFEFNKIQQMLYTPLKIQQLYDHNYAFFSGQIANKNLF